MKQFYARVRENDVDVVAGAVLASFVMGYLLLTLTGRALGPQLFGVFAGLWGALFLMSGILSPLEQEAARALAASGDNQPLRTALRRTALVFGSAAAAAVVLFGLVTQDTVFDGQPILVVVIAIAILSTAWQFTTRGSLLGQRRNRAYAAIVVLEAAIRLGLIVIALSVGGLVGAVTAVACGSLAWLPWAAVLNGRAPDQTEPAAAAGPPQTRQRDVLSLVVAAGCTAALVVGFPAFVRVAVPEISSVELGLLLATLTITRIPLLAFGTFQGLLIPYFTRLAEHGADRRFLLSLMSAIAIGGSVVVLAAALIGPWLLQLLYGQAYEASASEFAWLTAGAVLLTLLLAQASALVAHRRHGQVAWIWVVTLLGTIVALKLLPGDGLARVEKGLMLGPLLGMVVAELLYRHDRTRADVEAGPPAH